MMVASKDLSSNYIHDCQFSNVVEKKLLTTDFYVCGLKYIFGHVYFQRSETIFSSTNTRNCLC